MVGVVGGGFGVCDLLSLHFFLSLFSLVFGRLVRFPLHCVIYYRVLGSRYCGGPICTLRDFPSTVLVVP